MSVISRITTWTSQILTSASLNGEFNNVVNVLNNLDSATSTWTNVKAATINATSALQFNGTVFPYSGWVSYTPTLSPGFGTTSNTSFFWRQVGDTIFVKGTSQAGTVTSGTLSITLPNSTVINFSKMPSGINSTILGTYGIARGTPFVGLVISDGATNNKAFWTSGGASGSPGSVYATASGNSVFDNNDFFVVDFSYAV